MKRLWGIGLMLLFIFFAAWGASVANASHPYTDRDFLKPEACEKYALAVQQSTEDNREHKRSHADALAYELKLGEDWFQKNYGHSIPRVVISIVEHAVGFIYSASMHDKAAWEVAAAYTDECKRWVRTQRL